MEALVAIGLAGNVVQFVQFAGKLISEVKSMRKSSRPSSITDLKALAESLTKQTEMISKSLQGSTSPISDEDRFLLDLSSQCNKTGIELLTYLDKLLINHSSSNPIRSAGATVKLVFLCSKVEDFAMKLDKLRNALVLSSILAFRASANVNLEDILIHLRRLEKDSQNHGGNSAEILKVVESVAAFQDDAVPKLELIHEEVQGCLKQLSALKDDMPESREKEILRWLNFRQMTWRYEEVPSAYENTFKWIFMDNSQASVCNWDSFVSHLSQPNVTLPYFINGKAGSGKSTLLKYIIGHQKTKTLLHQWAGNSELAIVKFFFWNLGTGLQKTTLGMLRALLHDILAQYPELIPSVFSGMYQSWADFGIPGRRADENEPHLTEIKSAFKSLMRASAKFLKLCIIIDGIDELDGDHRDLSEFLYSLASQHIKIVVSARPLPVCLSVFRGCPSLELQRLTEPDIKLFVEENLACHRSMIALSRRFPQETKELVNELKEKAAGVFLWVRLVVRLLMDGIEAGDDVSDLRRKLRSLPADLRDLYRRMISKMDPDYRVQAAKIFQLLYTWKQHVQDQPFMTIILHFAMQNPSEAFSQPIQSLDAETSEWIFKNMEARIRSRCCGLLDVYSSNSVYAASESLEHMELDGSVVDYLHRTVAEFLTSDNIWDDICEIMEGSDFEASLGLASACISTIKTCQVYPSGVLFDNVNALLALCRAAPTFADDQKVVKYIDHMDTTVTQIRSQSVPLGKHHWSADLFQKGPTESQNALDYNMLRQSASIFSFVALHGISRYLVRKYDRHSRQHDKTAMVLYSLQSWNDQYRPTISLHDRTVILLHVLDSAALLMSLKFGLSPWRFVVEHICPRLELWDFSRLNARTVGESDAGNIHKKYLPDCAALIATCLTTTANPEVLISEIPQYMDLADMSSTLEKDEHQVLRNLGYKLERVIDSMKIIQYRSQIGDSSFSDSIGQQEIPLIPKHKDESHQDAESDYYMSTFLNDTFASSSRDRSDDSNNLGFTTPQRSSISGQLGTLSPASTYSAYLSPFQYNQFSISPVSRCSPSYDEKCSHNCHCYHSSPKRRRHNPTPPSPTQTISPFRDVRRNTRKSNRSRDG